MAERIQDGQLWIGLVEFRPLDPKSYGAAGAFTTIVTWASDCREFRAKCDIIADKLHMFVAGAEEVELLSRRARKVTLTEETEDMVFRAEANPNAIIYGTFHRYQFDEA